MYEKTISRLSIAINAIVFIGLGITICFLPTDSQKLFTLLSSLLLSTLGTIALLGCLLKRNTNNLTQALTTLSLGLFIHFFPNLFLSIFPFIFGFYILLNAIIKAITYFIYKKHAVKGRFKYLIFASIDLVYSIILILHPFSSLKYFTIMIGIYLVLLGTTHLYDLLKEFFPNLLTTTNRKIHFSPPVIFLALLPYKTITKINKHLNLEKTTVNVSKNVSGQKDLEIIIHVKDSGNNIFGHTDIYFEGKVLSYGNYDPATFRLKESIGDGILFEIKEKEKYLNFCMTHSHKTLFVFGITLTKEQKQKVKERIALLKKDCYLWNPLSKQQPSKKEQFKDYPSILYNHTNATFYKFKKGSFKTYFLLSTNCTKLVDYIVGAAGLDLLKLNGIITPGTYYNFLDSEFKRRNSNVISKEIYKEIKKEDSP